MKPKIEKVDHMPLANCESYFVLAYYKTTDTLSQSSFFSKKNALYSKNPCTVGMWKIKTLKNNYHAN